MKNKNIFSASREDSEEDGTEAGRKTVKSTIKFRPTSRDNQANIACEAQHPALLATPPMRVSVILSVQCEYHNVTITRFAKWIQKYERKENVHFMKPALKM